ncbi:MAG: amidase [Candidatus Tectomicrobia bacterium]|nr:amidase [Candidatus Tectomicrobia bacterium]
MTDDLTRLPGAEIARKVRKGELSAAAAAEAFLGRAERLGPKLNTWIRLDREGALRAARAVDEAVAARKDPGPLAGVPVGVKDLVDMAGLPTTAGSKIDRDRIAREDAPIVRRLRAAGAVILGKLNLHEYAYGPTGHNIHYGDMKNPWNPARVTGGSSGGSGNAVATGQAAFAIGSDTGGSIRIPASLCGVVGHKPTFGLVSKAGCVPLSWSLDTMGPLALTAEDCALAMSVLAGHDPEDPSSVGGEPPRFMDGLGAPLRGLRVGHARRYYADRSEPEVAEAVERVAKALAEAGARVEEVEIPDQELATGANTALMISEAAAFHEKNVRERPGDFDPRVLERIRPGLFVTATEYLQARRFRGEWAARVTREVFGRVDVLLSAATPITAPPIAEDTAPLRGRKLAVRGLLVSLTRLWNFFGGPSVAFPAGSSQEGLPIGAQLMGAPFSDARLLAAVHQLERMGAVAPRRAPFEE